MAAIERAIEWLEQNKGCGWDCLKCNYGIRLKFEKLDQGSRKLIVDAISSCDVPTFEKHRQLLWLLALLDDAEFEGFVSKWAERAPFDPRLAWQIIHLSVGNQGVWRFNIRCRPPAFRPLFHLHSAIAPSLLAATVRPEAQREDAMHLLDYFEAIANRHPVLEQALPAWRAELERRELERKAELLRQKEREQREIERCKAEAAAQEVRFQAVEGEGPAAVLRAVADAAPAIASACPERWAKIPEKALSLLSDDLLEAVVQRLSGERMSPAWHGLTKRIVHLRKSRARSEERRAYLCQIEQSALPEKLKRACESRWSLTYFPEHWASAASEQVDQIPDDLRTRLRSKLLRLRRRGHWRDLRRLLVRGEGSSASGRAARAQG